MKKLNGQQLLKALISGSNSLSNNSEKLNSMNVFPVPDGDTGSNMAATAEYASDEIKNMTSNLISEISSKFARGMLLGARGNSGVILSQVFKGVSVFLENKKEATQFDIVQAFGKAKDYAYKSVMKPVEGTILTVIRMIHEKLSKTVTPSHTIEEVFDFAEKFAKEACEKTPEFLPVLKEVGVTDAGGEGLYLMLHGMSEFFKGNPIERSKNNDNDNSSLDFLMNDEVFDGEFGYCTEFIVELKSPKAFKKEKFQMALEKHGYTSIIVVHDDDILKVHLHTLKPGIVLNFAQKFGEFIKIKSENMTLQANESREAQKSMSLNNAAVNNKVNVESSSKVEIGVIACNTGSGIINDMKDLGTNFIIEAGQTKNPSAQDFMKAINSLNTDKIILLPNNSNIILVAQQVVQTTDKEIIVIPTKTQMEGLSAMMNFDVTASLKDNQEMMEEAIDSVKTGQVTIAARTTRINGVSVSEGEFLSIAERKIIGSKKSKLKAAIDICKKLIDEDTELVTIYYGDDSTEIDANEISSYIETHYEAEVEVKNGQQSVYSFLMAFE